MDRIIENPLTGERFVVLTSPEESGGDLLKIDLSVSPKGFVTAEHIHPKQEERFSVTAGTIHLRINGVDQYYRAGEEAVVPPGVRHVWWNDSADEEARAIVEFRPALNILGFLETWFALATMGKLVANRPTPLQFAAIVDEYKNEIQAARPMEKALGVLLLALAPLARRLGYQGRVAYPERPAAAVVAAAPMVPAAEPCAEPAGC
jgi:quercetin dioxygenase-like cupin family protein